jgi:Ca2+-binding RTX toxin-like protein
VATSSARPSALRAFATTAQAVDTDTLSARPVALRSALDAFRASSGWTDFLDDVPPLDIDFGAVRGRLAQVATFVAEVAHGFAAADTTPLTDDVVTVNDAMLALFYVRTDLANPVTLVRDGNRWIFPGTDDRDFVRLVTRDGKTFLEVGTVVVVDGRRTVRWETRELTPDQAANLTIRTGGGEDFVGISPDINVRVTVWTGDGNDAVGMPGRNYSSRLGGGGNDLIFTGDGDDRVEGGEGDDAIYGGGGRDYVDGQGGTDRIVGGGGDDVLYGGGGNDTIDGGGGDDYLEGGSGDDALRGNDGRDLLSGGRGDDDLHGGAGGDDLFGGRGADTVEGGEGRDKATVELADTATGNEQTVVIELKGDPGGYAVDLGTKPDWMTTAEWDAWKERIDSDLEFLRTTHSGRAALAALDDAAHDSDSGWNPFDDDTKIRILPYAPWDGHEMRPPTFDQYVEALLNGEQLPGEDPDHAGTVTSLVRSDRDYQVSDLVSYGHSGVADFSYGPPSLTLQHELSHAFDSLHGGTSDGDEGATAGDYTEVLRDADGNVVLDAGGQPRRAEVSRAELNSMGLDVDGDGRPDTVESGDGTAHPTEFTENALRLELRRPLRDSYTMGTQDGRQPGEHVTYENAD